MRILLCSLCALALCGLALPPSAAAQISIYTTTYRPPEATYRVLRGERVDLIYQTGAEAEAERMREALHRTWTGTDALVGSTPQRIHTPVVVNRFNDRSNGFVTPLPYKQENEAVTRRSPQLVGRAASWPVLVATHELVHSVHAEVNPGFGWGGLLRVFAPDAARALNLTAPRGLIEGIAVYRESTFEGEAGRLNAPRFQMKMRAAMLSDDPWSLTQMLEIPAHTQPFNRFYIGGAHAFAHWMEADSSASFFHEASSLYNRFPFLGYGVPLWAGTGDAPNVLRTSLRAALRRSYQATLDARRPLTEPSVIAGNTGTNYRRPYWLSDSTLVAHVKGYAVRPGFYRIDAATGARTRIRTQTIPEGRVYSLAPDTTALLTARYVPDAWSSRQWIAEVERVRLSDGRAERLTDHGRAFAPWVNANGTVSAFQNDGSVTHWADVHPSGTAEPVTRFADTRFQQAARRPGSDTVALLVNVNGATAIHRATRTDGGAPTVTPWLAIRNALIYDLSWSADGRYLLFGADANGVANILAFDTQTDRVLRLTNVAFGAFEPALSPDGSTVAFINYRHERHDLVQIPFRPDAANALPASRVLRGSDLRALRPSADETSADETSADETSADETSAAFEDARPYRAWRYLRPRMAYPVVRYDGDEADFPDTDRFETLGVGFGLGLAGADPLQRWSYQGSAYWQDGRVWGNGIVETARWRLRPSLAAAWEPSTLPIQFNDGASGRIGLEERSATLGLRAPVTLQSNAYQSFAQVALQNEVRQTRFFGDVAEALESNPPGLRDWDTRYTLTPSAFAGYRLQQNPRDLIPNTGLAISGVAEVDAWTDGVPESQALIAQVFAYLPVARRTHTGVRLDAALITQNRGSIFNLDTVVPRGYEDDVLGSGSFLRLGAEVIQPLAYVDDGLTLLPVYVKSLYTYGFGQTLGRVEDGPGGPLRSSVGGGLGLRTRFFYLLDLDLRIGLTYRVEPGTVAVTAR
jgi:hypothetical protein